ncbi:hypothetical protein DER44DRAFT_764229 [Fusarium oxysporum]|nr:hypothetical protein DER44DRAFT_764229 [Fusarium oxysporum]
MNWKARKYVYIHEEDHYFPNQFSQKQLRMSACKWIDVQFSGREEFCPTLVEHRPAYSVFDCQAFQPRVVLSIGGIEKRRFYRRINLNDAVDGNPGVLLRPVQLATLILDCELHNHNRLDAVQQYHSRGEKVMHSLQANLYRHGPSHKIAQYAFDMYWQLLYPFASTVLLFIDDLGGVGPVIEILALWARRARLSTIPAPPRILVLYHWRNRTEMESFESRLRSRIMCTVSGTQANSQTGITSPIYLQGEMAFESVQLIPTWKAASEFPSQTEESFAARDAAGYGFSSDHLKRLLQTAILQYSQSSGQQIDFVQAVRFCNPPPTQLTEKLIQFLSITKDAEMDHVAVIASALDLDAHPPGMHFFAPQTTFGKTYRAAVSQVESLLNEDGLSDQVCKKFTQFSLERQGSSSAHAHLRLLSKYQATWRDYVEGNLCFVCLVRPPSTTLDCHHRLCDACVMICGSRESPDSPSFQVLSCPLCGKHHRRKILLQPPTSGNRVLELGGASKYKWEMLKFLKEVQSAIGLPVPLQEHFDLVIGSGIGLFFVQTVFLEGWDLSDCQYHLKNVGDPEVDRKQSLVSFGKNLTWKMGRTANCNGAHLVFIFEGHHSAARHTELRMNLRHREPDFTVRYLFGWQKASTKYRQGRGANQNDRYGRYLHSHLN